MLDWRTTQTRTNTRREAAVRPMNGAKPNAREVIARILADERLSTSSHFSERVYGDEPILTTGRQMASYLPDEYRRMRAVSRWQEGEGGAGGRWLSEAELFYRQGTLMADFEDDCPYHGTFKSYFPTYNAMSDRQLRGYFTWRAAVRRGIVGETSLSFAYVYLYELINGIGVADPHEGFRALESFWRSYREIAPEIDRFASVWLQDYVVYHGLPAELLEPYKALSFDRSLMALRAADEHARVIAAQAAKRKRGISALPLPARASEEQELFCALDALSTYHLAGSRLYKQQPDALRHVACAVFVRMSSYYQRQRSSSLIESWFGEEVSLSYTMFGSAMFFEPEPHANAVYELDPIHRYRCDQGRWTCERFHGSRSKSPKLGSLMRGVDRCLREALGFEHPLKMTGKTPKYVQKFIDEEISAWMSWQAAHAPRHIEIDVGQLAGIRATAAVTCDALLIEEERTGEGSLLEAACAHDAVEESGANDPAKENWPRCSEQGCEVSSATFSETSIDSTQAKSLTDSHTLRPNIAASSHTSPGTHCGQNPLPATSFAVLDATSNAPLKPAGPAASAPPLAAHELAYLSALLSGDQQAIQDARTAAGVSEDLLMDAINEALFDMVGDTVLEFGADGPALIDDYRDDVEGMLSHA